MTSVPHGFHPSGARYPGAAVYVFPERAAGRLGTHGLHLEREPTDEAPRPDGTLMHEVADTALSLLTDARSTLTEAQQAQALQMLAELREEAALDAIREDPDVRAVDLPGRASTALLRILIARAFFVEEHTA